MERSRLTLLPEGYPEVLVKDLRVKNILPKAGDEMVADWLKIHSNYGTLICSLQNQTKSDNVRCCLYIPADQDHRIILFSRLHEVHKEGRENRDGKTPKLTTGLQKQIKKVTSNSINSQLYTLKHHFDANGIPLNNLEISCIVCVGTESDTSEVNDLLEKVFTEIRKNLKDAFKTLEFEKVVFCSENETLRQESFNTFEPKIDPDKTRSQPTGINDHIKRFVPKPYQIAVKTCEYEYKEFPQEGKIKLDSAGIEDFLGKYFEDRDKKVITLPDFDRIKCTKLFPVIENESSINLKRNSKPNPDWRLGAMAENGGMFAYIGEIKQFWPHFHEKWFPNAKGVLMHSFCEKQLNTILASRIKFGFEFDWLYWSRNHVTLFEVGMKETDADGEVKGDKIIDNIREKLNKAFQQYLPVLKILFYYLPNSSQKKEAYKNLIDRYFSIVLFFPSIDHGVLRNQLESYLQNRERFGDFTENEMIDLKLIHFVGNSKVCATDGFHFYRYNDATKQISNVESGVLLKNHPSSSFTEDDVTFERMLGLFAITYFCSEGSNVIGNFEQGPGCLLERYQDFQKKFITDVHDLKGIKKDLFNLDVLLSPQQFEILLEDEIYVRCVGESGSGKTETLLSKALISSLKEDVEHVYFCIPRHFLSETPLMDIVYKYKMVKNIEKMKILAGEEIYDALVQLKHTDLSKTVVIIDEFQDKYERFISVSEEKFLELSHRVFPYLRNCWIASATLKWSYEMRKKFSSYALYERFCMRPMNVTFRSSGHIAEFCSNLATYGRDNFLFATSRVKGVFTSKQTSVATYKFPKNVILRTSKEADARNYPSKQYPKAYLGLNFEYSQNRWFVVLCSRSHKKQWSTKLDKIYRIDSNTEKYKLFVACVEDGPAGCTFSGGEAYSVIIYIDGPEEKLNSRNNENYDSFVDMLLMACSRAQYELVIHIRNDIKSIYSLLQKCKNRTEKGISIEETLQKLRESRELGSITWQKLLTMKNGVIPYILMTIEHRPIPPTLIKNLEQYLGNNQLSDFLQGHDNRFILLQFGQMKAFSLLTVLLKGKNFSNYKSYQSCIKWCLRVGYRKMSEWLIQLIEMRGIQEAFDVGESLPILCFRRNLMERWLQKLQEWKLLENGLQTNMKFDTGIPNEECGLMTLLTFANVDFANEDYDCYSDWQKLILETPPQYLFDELFTKSALHYAINHRNAKSIKFILGRPQWKQKLWEPNEIENFRTRHFLGTTERFRSMKSIPCVRSVGYNDLLPAVNVTDELEFVFPLYEEQHIQYIRSSCYIENVDYLKRRRSLPSMKLNDWK